MSEDGGIETTLIEWYRRFIGEPERQVDVYAGFALFFGGLALSIVGLAVFAVEQVAFGPGKEYSVRQIAFAVGALGLPTLFLGVTVLLPVDRRARIGAVVGEVVCLVAIAFFTRYYPYQWDVSSGPDYSMQGVGIYAVGIVTVVAATFAALVSYHVERVTPAEVVAETSEEDDGPEVTDEDVRRDIDEAMADADLSWGGVAKRETKRLELNTAPVDDIDRTSMENATAKTTRTAGVDDAVNGLKELRGGEKETASGGGTDDQTTALNELRKQRAAERQAEADRGVVERVRRLFD